MIQLVTESEDLDLAMNEGSKPQTILEFHGLCNSKYPFMSFSDL